MKTTRNPNAPEPKMERRPARPSPETDANSRLALLASLSPAEIRKAQRTTAGRQFLARLKGDLEHRTPGKSKAKPSTALTLKEARTRALKLRTPADRKSQ
jgi:hypothetical protein